MMCEQCWSDAYTREFNDPSKDQAEHYRDLLTERGRSTHTICTHKEQTGGWWDDEKEIDRRML